TFCLEARVSERIKIVEPVARPHHKRIGGPIVGIGALHQVIALRKPGDDVATMRTERVAHEADRLRIPRVCELPVELLRQKLAELVLESLALVVGERQVMRIGADAQDVRVDKFEAGIEARTLCMRRTYRDRHRRYPRHQRDQQKTAKDSRLRRWIART